MISVRVVPRSSLEDIALDGGGVWKARLTAPALEGRANESLISMLSKRLGIRKSAIEIISGEKARLKRIRLTGIEGRKIEEILSAGISARKKA